MEREAVTIRFPADLLVKAKKLKFVSESLNDLVVEALAREVRRRRGWADHQRIIAQYGSVKELVLKIVFCRDVALLRLYEDLGA